MCVVQQGRRVTAASTCVIRYDDAYAQYTASDGPALLLDGERRILAANAEWTLTWGYTEKEAVGAVGLLHGPDTPGANLDQLTHACAERRPITVLLTYYTKAGTAARQSVSSSPVGTTHFVETCSYTANGAKCEPQSTTFRREEVISPSLPGKSQYYSTINPLVQGLHMSRDEEIPDDETPVEGKETPDDETPVEGKETPNESVVIRARSLSTNSNCVWEADDETNLMRAQMKFNQFDTERKGFLDQAEISRLSEWLWAEFHWQAATPQELKSVSERLVTQIANPENGRIYFQEFMPWFEKTHKSLTRHKEVMATPPASPTRSPILSPGNKRRSSKLEERLDLEERLPSNAEESREAKEEAVYPKQDESIEMYMDLGMVSPSSLGCCYNRQPLVVALIFALVIMAGQLGLWYILLDMAGSSINAAGSKYLGVVMEHTRLTIDSAQNSARNIVNTIELAGNVSEILLLTTPLAIVDGTVTSSVVTSAIVNSPCLMTAYAAGLVAMTPMIDWAGIGLEDGSFYSVIRQADGVIYAWVVDAQNVLGQGTMMRMYQLDEATGCYDLNRYVPGSEGAYDPRVRPWYSATKERQHATWSSTYQDFVTGRLTKTASAPLWDKQKGRMLGVIAADCTLSHISESLQHMTTGKTGVALLTEVDAEAEFVIASSAEKVGPSKVTMAESPDVTIQATWEEYCHHVNCHHSNNTNFAHGGSPGSLITHGEQPMVARRSFMDRDHNITLNVWVGVPADDFYGFTFTLNIMSLVCFGIGLMSASKFVYGASKLTSMSDRRGWKKIAAPVIGVFVLGALQLGVWLVLTKFATDDIAEFLLYNKRRSVADMLQLAVARMVHRTNVSAMVYHIHGLNLGASTDLQSNPGLDLHLHSSLLLNPDLASSYIGFETGEYYETRRQCRFATSQMVEHSTPPSSSRSTAVKCNASCSSCDYFNDDTSTNMNPVGQSFDLGSERLLWALAAGKTTRHELIAFETVNDPNRSRAELSCRPSACVVPEGKYALPPNCNCNQTRNYGRWEPYNQAWYTRAVAKGKMTHSLHFGMPVVSPLEFTESGALLLRLSQALYDTSGNVMGVLGVSQVIDHWGSVLVPMKKLAALGFTTVGAAIIQEHGEVISASNGVLALRTTPGKYMQVNATSSSDEFIAAFATTEWKKNNSISERITGQGWTDLSSQVVKFSGRLARCLNRTESAAQITNEFTCSLSMIIMLQRDVFFASLDASISQAFTLILFGFALIIFLIVSIFTKSKDNLEALGVVRDNHHRELNKRKSERAMQDEEMFEEIREMLSSMQDRWPAECRGMAKCEKAIEYMKMADGRDSQRTFCLEAHFGHSSLNYIIFYFLDSKKMRTVVQMLLVSFVFVDFLPASVRLQVDASFLGLLTVHAALKEYAIGFTDQDSTIKRWGTLCVFWGFWTVGLCTDYHLLGAIRPVLLIVKSRGVRAMWRLMWMCIQSARTIVVLFFTVTAVTAVMATLLFARKFDPDAGQTIDNFLDSFVASFVFLVSLENYGLVHQGYTVTRMAWIFFVPISIIGVFFLTSMVIARFELAYTKYKKVLSEFQSTQKRFAIAVAFALSTDSELQVHTFVDMMTSYWDSRGVDLNGIRNRMARIQMAQSSLTTENDSLSISTPRKAVAYMIFEIIDRDNSLTISFDEFEFVYAVSECVAVISNDPLVGFQSIACRMELLLKESRERLARLAPDKTAAQARVLDQINRQEFVFEQAVDQLSQCKTRIHRGMRLTRYVTMAALDQVTMVALISHMFVLSLYGTTEDLGWVDAAAIGFCGFYTAEMCCRLAAAKSWSNFCNDPRGNVYSFRNVTAFILWFIGIISTAIGLYVDQDERNVWIAVSSLALWRIFVVSESFRNILYSCSRGLGSVSYLVLVIMIFFYFYAYAAHKIFKNLTFDDAHVDFSTLTSSCLTMVQVFLGEGWHEVMYSVDRRSNKAVVFLFGSYAFLVLVLFSQLFIGIVIEMFQSYEGMRSSFHGQCSLAFMAPLADTNDERRNEMLKELGRISATLYAPELLHFARLGRYQHAITSRYDGNTVAWASALVANGYRRHWKRKWISSFRRSIAEITASSDKWSRTLLVTKLHESYSHYGLDCNRSIHKMEQLFVVVKRMCLQFDDCKSDLILCDLMRQINNTGSSLYLHPKVRPWSFVCFASFVTHRLAVFSGLNPDLCHMHLPPSKAEQAELQSMYDSVAKSFIGSSGTDRLEGLDLGDLPPLELSDSDRFQLLDIELDNLRPNVEPAWSFQSVRVPLPKQCESPILTPLGESPGLTPLLTRSASSLFERVFEQGASLSPPRLRRALSSMSPRELQTDPISSSPRTPSPLVSWTSSVVADRDQDYRVAPKMILPSLQL